MLTTYYKNKTHILDITRLTKEKYRFMHDAYKNTQEHPVFVKNQ